MFPIEALMHVDNVGVFPPISPTQLVNGRQWLFNAVTGQGSWYDPTAASSYIYATDGLSKFTQVGLPQGLGDLDGKYTVTDAVNGSVVVNAGAFYTFPSPVTTFTVSGINPTVNGDDQLAFPTYLKFDQGIVSFTMTPVAATATLRGDFNRDGQVNASDIPAMLAALVDLNSFKTANSLTATDLLSIGDINVDGAITNADLQALLTLLKSGGGSLAGVPEPTSMELASIGALALLAVTLVRKIAALAISHGGSRPNCRVSPLPKVIVR